MPGNYRYEEERNRGQRGGRRESGRGAYDDRLRDEEDYDLQDRERYGRPNYGREEEGRYGSGGSWNRGERDYGRSLGGRASEGFEDEGRFRGSYGSMGREENRYGGYGREQRGQQWSGRGYGQGGGFAGGRGGSQADGWTSEPEEMRWGRHQGLYGSSEYGGYLSSQRSQSDYPSHVGKGPKNWQRSDEHIKDEVSEALARHPEIDASDLEIRVDKGEVTLTGTVSDRNAKRMAEDVAERVFGTKEVQNQIRVQSSGTSPFGDREVTRTPDREGRTTSEAHLEGQTRKPGTTSTGGSAPR